MKESLDHEIKRLPKGLLLFITQGFKVLKTKTFRRKDTQLNRQKINKYAEEWKENYQS